MDFDISKFKWINKPNSSVVNDNKIIITTEPETDLWQRTYYGFSSNNAHAFVMSINTDFTFTVKAKFNLKMRYDQCGVVIYQDSNNWFKASIEYENDKYQSLGSVVTNKGYSDWATSNISTKIEHMYYRLSRRSSDFLVENSLDGMNFKQMRIFHLFEGQGLVNFGVYACSPLESIFDAVFTELKLCECIWEKHKS